MANAAADDKNDKLIEGLQAARNIVEFDATHYAAPGAQAHAKRILARLDTSIADLQTGKAVGADELAANNTPYDQLVALEVLAAEYSAAARTVSWLRQVHETLEPPVDSSIANDETFNAAAGAISTMAYRALAQEGMKERFDQAKQQAGLDDNQLRNLELIRQGWFMTCGLGEEKNEAWALLTNKGYGKWAEAKPNSDFAAVRDVLQELFDSARERGQSFADELGLDSPYEGLLAEYNADLPLHSIKDAFAKLRTQMPALMQEIQQKQASEPPVKLPFDIPEEVMDRVAKRVADDMGYDLDRGRIDKTRSAFTSGINTSDVRQTYRGSDTDPFSGLYCLVHETGHALFEQNRPHDPNLQPINEVPSMWVHETQSYFWELMIGESPEFFDYLQPILVEELKKEDAFKHVDFASEAWSPRNLHKLVTQAKVGLIRVDEKGVSIPLHIVLRGELEQELVEGKLTVDDLPAEWNKRMKELTGLDVPDDKHGCLQDIHWFDGAIGYFPAYLFGEMGAAQMKAAMRKDIPDLSDKVRQGDFKPIVNWLREKVHSKASSIPGDEMIRQATGEDLNAQHFIDELKGNLLSPYDAKWASRGGDKGGQIGVA